MITIRVFRSGGGPISGKDVKIHDGGISTKRTDSTGTANFENLKRGKYEIYIDGKRVYKGPIVDVQVVYVN